MSGEEAVRRGLLLRGIEGIVVLAIVSDFARVVARLIGLATPLLWDEAVYAVRGRNPALLDFSEAVSERLMSLKR